jgi:hypothetical protein
MKPNHTMASESFKHALHLSKLIPLGKKSPEKKEAVHKLLTQCKKFLAEHQTR